MVGLKDESSRTSEIEGVLTAAISGERMKVTRSSAHIGESRRGGEHSQAAPEDQPLLRPKTANAAAVGLAVLSEPPIGPRNVDSFGTS